MDDMSLSEALALADHTSPLPTLAGRALKRLRAHLEMLREVDVDRKALLRALDVALNGEAGAAAEPGLGDLLAQVRHAVRLRGAPLLVERRQPELDEAAKRIRNTLLADGRNEQAAQGEAWSRRMAAAETGLYVGAGAHGIEDRPAPPAQPAERVPEGWVLVPRELDAEMLDVAIETHLGFTGEDEVDELWAALIAAAPAPSEGGKGGGGMSDLSNKPKPHYGPVYAAALYPELATIARAHGYALAVHGSLARDLDVIGVPWVEQPSTPEVVIDAITSRFAVKLVGGPPSDKPHGRRVWTLSVGFGECFIDLSFMPTTGAAR